MRHFNLDSLSFLQIQIFIAAARELNYTRAAKICNVTQPTVSRSMDALEKTLGLRLFIRNGNHMQLSPAGRLLYSYFQDMLRQLEEHIATAHQLQQGWLSQFHLICPETIDHNRYLFPIVKQYSRKNPKIRIHYTLTDDLNRIIEEILSCQANAAIFHTFSISRLDKYPGIDYKPLVSTPLTAFMLRTNPLSCRDSVSISDLRAQKFFLPNANKNPEYFHMIMDYFYRNGIIPQIAGYTSSIAEGILNLQDNDEVNIADQFLMELSHPDCVRVPIRETESGLIILWRKNDESDSITSHFVSYCADYFSRYYTQNK